MANNVNKMLHKLLRLSVILVLLTLCAVTVDCQTMASCDETPHPETCNRFMVASSIEENTMFSFHDVALRTTMDQAIQVHRHISSMDISSFDGRARLAWSDCLELYENTMDQLNRSISSSTVRDSQTWLSATITNSVTCQNGFKELNLESSYLQHFPNFMMSNFSNLLANSLAINNAYALSSPPSSEHHQVGGGGKRRLLGDGFPAWVSASDRKLLQSNSETKANLVVAKDGSGNFKTISEAVAASSKLRSGNSRFVIYVKAGTYTENVEIERSMKNLMIVGDGIDATVVTGSRNAQDGSTTFRSATFAVTGDGFIARDMTFQNTAGPQKHQAVALRSGSDFSVFHRCSFKGYQDTLYVYAQRQFYRDCDVYGTVDFIFGDAVVVLQNCNIYARKPMSGQTNTVTAQARTDPNQNTGIVIHGCRITATSDLRPVQGSVKTFLGRPWQKYSRTVVMKSTLDGVIDPKGWFPWSGSFALSTLYYGEYMNTGAGAGTGGRVNWPGYHVITSASDAGKFTVGNFLAGGSWIPATGVPFSAGL